MNSIEIIPIGVVHSSRTQPVDDDWDTETSFVELDSTRFSPDSLSGLADFSHAEILFHMNQVAVDKIEYTARHPRNRMDWPEVGIFAQRGKNRPNRIGATICRIMGVDGLKLHVAGLDAVDGSPVLDIKPWFTNFGPRGAVFQPQWISELMQGYWRK